MMWPDASCHARATQSSRRLLARANHPRRASTSGLRSRGSLSAGAEAANRSRPAETATSTTLSGHGMVHHERPETRDGTSDSNKGT